MESEGTFEGGDAGGTLTGKAPAARIFALVILSLAVLLGSLLAVSAIGRSSDDGRAVTAAPAAAASDRGDANGVLVVPRDEPAAKPKPKATPKPVVKAKKPAVRKATRSTPQVEAASSASTPAAAPVQPSSTPAPAQQAAPAPTPTPAPAPTPQPAATPKPAAKQPAPVRHTVVVTE